MLAKILLTLAAAAFLYTISSEAVEPVFRLDFSKGLTAEVKVDAQWQEVDGSWNRTTAPEFAEVGLTGPALQVEHRDGAAWVGFDTPVSAHKNGTFLFWVRGLTNLDIFGLERGNPFRLLNSWGAGGLGWTALAFSPSQGWTSLNLQGTGGRYPRFNMYQWNQIGFSWQDERVRLYLNGDMVHEGPSALPFERFAIGDYERTEGSLRLYDNIKIWDRLLTEAEVKHIWRQDGQIANRPLVSIPWLDAPPELDGNIDQREWAGAAMVTGMLEALSGEAAVDGSTFYLGRDDDYLYLAMQGEMTELARTSPAAVMETFVRAKQTGRNEKIDTDDAVEFIIAPDYWRVDLIDMGRWMEYELNFQQSGINPNRYFYDQMVFFQEKRLGGWREYRLVANSGDGHFESWYDSGGMNAEWSPRWERASSVSNLGWQFEARVPLAAFGRTPGDGEEWGLQLSRIWRHLKEEENVWAWGHRQNNGIEHDMYVNNEHDTPRAAMGVLRFAQVGEPVVRVQKTGNLADKEIDWQADIYNPAQQERKIDLRLYTDTDELEHKEEISIPAGGLHEFRRQHLLENYASGQVTFEVEAEDGTLLHRTAIPFYLHQDFGVRVAQFPHYDRFLLDLDLGTLAGIPAEEISIDITVNDKDGNLAMSDTGRTVSSHNQQLEGDSSDIVPGDYVMSVVIRADEVELGREEIDFVRPGRAVWYDNHHGFQDVETDRVPYPWTDMELEGNRIKVWGRQYSYNNKLLPEQVTTLAASVLRAPMSLRVKAEKDVEIDTAALDALSEWPRTARTRVDGKRRVDTELLTITNSFWAEYDGFVWNTLTVEPAGKMRIENLRIEVPLSKEFSDVIKALRVVGDIESPGYELRGDIFYCNPWLGNGDGGIQIFLDADFHLQDRNKSIVVEVLEDGASVILKIIDMPTEIDAPYEVRFGFMATPVRPNLTRTPYFRPRSIKGGGPFYPAGLESLPAPDPGFDPYGYGSKAGRIYVWTDCISIAVDASGTEDFRHYGAEWMKDPFQRPRQGWNTQVIKPYGSKSFIDYFVWRHWRFQDKYGYGGLYYDNPNLGTFENRELIKRMYNITLDNHFISAREAALGLASNGIYNMAFGAFFSYQWNGEHLNSAIHANQPTYLGLLDPGKYRAEYMGHNWGWPQMFLGQGRIRREWVDANGGPEKVFDQIYGLGLIHDSMSLCCILPGGVTRELQNRRQDDVAKLDLAHWMYQWTPYWEQDIVTLPDAEIYASFYIARPSLLTATDPAEHMNRSRVFHNYIRNYEQLPLFIQRRMVEEIEKDRDLLTTKDDRAVMVVYNDTDWEGEMRLEVDWDKIGLGPATELTAVNYLHRTGFRLQKSTDADGREVEQPVFFERPEEYARIEDGAIVFPMSSHNYRMIVMERN